MLLFHLRRLIKWDQYHNIDLQDPCQALLEKKWRNELVPNISRDPAARYLPALITGSHVDVSICSWVWSLLFLSSVLFYCGFIFHVVSHKPSIVSSIRFIKYFAVKDVNRKLHTTNLCCAASTHQHKGSFLSLLYLGSQSFQCFRLNFGGKHMKWYT